MRTFTRLFGLACGFIVIAIAARYGFKTSDNELDGYIWAFTYGAVTLGGLFGHALGVRAWRHNKPVGALVFAGSAFALTISLSNQIGAMSGRGNEQQAERIKVADTVRDARRSLRRAEEEREGLKFTPTDADAVTAARAKAATATATREAECSKLRGTRCRDKETAEGQALADLETATKNKALTDRAAIIDASIAALKDKIERAGPVLEANSQGSALARLFDMPDAKAATLSTYQNLAMAMVMEFLIVISLVASEVIEHGEKTPAPAAPSPKIAARKDEPEAVISGPVFEAVAVEREPVAFPAPPKPRLISSRADPVGSVIQIMGDILEPATRGKVEIAEAFKAYTAECGRQGKKPVPVPAFSDAIEVFCERLGIQVKPDNGGVFLLKVKVRKPAKRAEAQ